jgi:tetratricopeptide (TPR) repeat protein
MATKMTTGTKRALFAAILACGGMAIAGLTPNLAVGGQAAQSQPAPQQQTPAPADKDKQPNPPPLSMDTAPAATSSPEEDAASKAVLDTPQTDAAKRIQLAEAFLQKYPTSRYRPVMYQTLVSEYFATQQVPKLLDAADKEVQLNPNDAPIMAVAAQTLARTYDPKAPNAAQTLDKAEQYSKRAIEITPTLPKPANLTDEAFTVAKNDTLEMAHGGLGLVYIRQAKYTEAVPELEAAIKSNTHPQPDPVNFYLLGVADMHTSHFDEATTAFNKCAEIQSPLQTSCKTSSDAAKKQGATQLSAPK